MSNPLTVSQQRGLCGLLHMALKEIRQLSWDGKAEQAADLADAICALPLYLFSSDFPWDPIRDGLSDYQRRYAEKSALDYGHLLKAIEHGE